jgi:DNA-binding MarR family transcriptional regulator
MMFADLERDVRVFRFAGSGYVPQIAQWEIATITATNVEHRKMVEIYNHETYHALESVGFLILRVRSQLLVCARKQLAANERLIGLDPTSALLFVMETLAASEGPISAAELCRGLSYNTGAMTRLLDRLENKGLISRTRRADDRRVVCLQLTPKGRGWYPRIRESAILALNRLLRGFVKAEVQQLEAMLARMLKNAPEPLAGVPSNSGTLRKSSPGGGRTLDKP